MKRWVCAVILGLFFMSGFPSPAGAEDQLVVGVTGITGINAGLWVAHEGGIFEKYDIEPHPVLITSASGIYRLHVDPELGRRAIKRFAPASDP